jgi:hypothetical protein
MLAVVLALAAISKARGRKPFADFIQTLERFGFPKPWAGSPLALAVIALETASALLLLAVPTAGYALALVLFSGFTLGIARVLRRGERVQCRCFGASNTPMGTAHLVRNGILISVTLLGAVSHGAGPHASLPEGVSLVAGVVGVLAGLFITRWEDLVFLLRGPGPVAGPPSASKKLRG